MDALKTLIVTHCASFLSDKTKKDLIADNKGSSKTFIIRQGGLK
jgi:hypothetical protein